MSGGLVRMVALGLAGLVLSAGLGSAAYLLTRDTIGLAVTELGASAPRIPTASTRRPAVPSRVVARTAHSGATTVRTRTEITETDDSRTRTRPTTVIETGDDSRTETAESSGPRTSTEDDSDSGSGRSGGGNSGRGGRDD